MKPDAPLLPRHLANDIIDALGHSRIVNVVGARQVGKTTLVREMLRQGRFISLDDETALAAVEDDPWGQLQHLVEEAKGEPVIIDEAQRSRRLPLALKRIVDANRRKGQFVLTGSSNIFSAKHVTDSLAGRVLTLKLWPLTAAETMFRGPSRLLDWSISESPDLSDVPAPEPCSRADCVGRILRGGYPDIRTLEHRHRQRAYRQYVDAMVERDVPDILRIRRSDALRRLIDQMAVRTSSELNVAELCRLVGIRRGTAEQFLDVLLRLSLIIRLGAWSSGEHRREVRSAKFHFADTGIAAALRNMQPNSFGPDGNPMALRGLLESFVLSELLRSQPHQGSSFRFRHWRDQRGREIDILAECGNRIAAIKVKASSSVDSQDFRHLRWFSEEGPGLGRTVTSIVIHLGDTKLKFGDRQFAVPIGCLWGE